MARERCVAVVRIILIVGALLVAGLAGLVAQRYLASQRAQLEQDKSQFQSAAMATVDVLVTVADVPAASIVTASALGWQSWPEAGVNPKYILRTQRPRAIDELANSATRQSLTAGEPVIETRLIKRQEGGALAVVLKEGRRAITIKADETLGMAGMLLPGDHVDILLTHKVSSGSGGNDGEISSRGEQTVTEVIMRNVRILAVDTALRTAEKAPATVAIPKTLTLDVTPQEAEVLFLSRTLGALSFTLRSAFGEGSPSPVDGDGNPALAGDDNPALAGARQPDAVREFTRDADISSVLRAGIRRPRILVASRDLAAGTLLTEADLIWHPIDTPPNPELHFVAGADALRSLRGSLVRDSLKVGDALKRVNVVRPADSRFVALALRPGMRAISISVVPQSIVSGFVSPGDTVDIIMTGTINDGSDTARLKSRTYSETIARSMRVLSLKVTINKETGLPEAGGTATLEATPRQAEMISAAGVVGSLLLTLVPDPEVLAKYAQQSGLTAQAVSAQIPNAPLPSFTSELGFSSAIRTLVGGFGNQEPADSGTLPPWLPGGPPAAPSNAASGKSIMIYRGATPTTLTVDR